ncbi:MAG TPA: invasion associated locus B family protein [Roseomonas sp.]|jgi:invasion protein IalB
MNVASRLLLLLPLFAGTAALAQTRPATPPAAPAAAPAPAPSASTPERTLSSFGDWVVRCEQRPAGGRGCEMAQTSTDQRQQPVAVLALGRPARGEPLRLVAQVPVNITTAQAARITIEPALVLPFKSCTPRGCFAELEMRDAALLQRLRSRAADAAARLEWRDAAGQEAGVALSFRGFAAAYDALSRETE